MCILMPLPVGRTLCVYGHILIYTQACISDREGRLCLCSFDALLRREFSGDAAYQAARRVFPPVAADSEVCCVLCAVLVVDLCAGGSGQPICGLPIWEGAV